MGDLVDLTKALEARRVAIPEGGELDIIYRTSEVLELGDRQFTEGWKACTAANATLRADRDALAARVVALVRELRIEREDHARYLAGGHGAPVFRAAAQERLEAIDAALAASAPGATTERGGTEGGEG